MSDEPYHGPNRHIVCDVRGRECSEVIYTSSDGARYGNRLPHGLPHSHRHHAQHLSKTHRDHAHDAHIRNRPGAAPNPFGNFAVITQSMTGTRTARQIAKLDERAGLLAVMRAQNAYLDHYPIL